METTLHKDLKRLYAGHQARTEVRVGPYRIDAVRDDVLVEIQHAGLSSIRAKILRLLDQYDILVVKPIVREKVIVRQIGRLKVIRRRSPKRGRIVDLFDELVHFVNIFPHPRLQIEVVLVDIEEHREMGVFRGRRRRRPGFRVIDQRLTAVQDTFSIHTADDLLRLLPARLPSPFDTSHLATGLEIDRWLAQKAAYTLRHAGALRAVGKRGNSIQYEVARTPSQKRNRAGEAQVLPGSETRSTNKRRGRAKSA